MVTLSSEAEKEEEAKAAKYLCDAKDSTMGNTVYINHDMKKEEGRAAFLKESRRNKSI